MEQNGQSKLRARRHLGIVVVGIIMALLLAVGYLFSSGPETVGNRVLVAVRGYLSVEQKQALTRQFAGYAPEQDEAAFELIVYEFPAVGAQDAGETAKLFGELMNEWKTGEADLILLDAYVYEMIGDERQFARLDERFPQDPNLRGSSLYAIGGKPFANAAGLEELPELFLAMRSEGTAIVNKNAQSLERYSYQAEILNNIAKSTPPKGFSNQGLQ